MIIDSFHYHSCILFSNFKSSLFISKNLIEKLIFIIKTKSCWTIYLTFLMIQHKLIFLFLNLLIWLNYLLFFSKLIVFDFFESLSWLNSILLNIFFKNKLTFLFYNQIEWYFIFKKLMLIFRIYYLCCCWTLLMWMFSLFCFLS